MRSLPAHPTPPRLPILEPRDPSGPPSNRPAEKKRREAIRYAFDRLTTLVPGIEGQGRSEGVVLQKTAEYLHVQLEENQRLVEELERRGGDVPDNLKM